MDSIIDSITEAMLENVMKANEQMGKILLKNYDPMEVDKAQDEYELRLKEIKQSSHD